LYYQSGITINNGRHNYNDKLETEISNFLHNSSIFNNDDNLYDWKDIDKDLFDTKLVVADDKFIENLNLNININSNVTTDETISDDKCLNNNVQDVVINNFKNSPVIENELNNNYQSISNLHSNNLSIKDNVDLIDNKDINKDKNMLILPFNETDDEVSLTNTKFDYLVAEPNIIEFDFDVY